MKKQYMVFLAAALASTSYATFAAQEITADDGHQPIGVVSTQGQSTLSDVTQALREKANDAGAGKFEIISAGGNNQYYGVAKLYK